MIQSKEKIIDKIDKIKKQLILNTIFNHEPGRRDKKFTRGQNIIFKINEIQELLKENDE